MSYKITVFESRRGGWLVRPHYWWRLQSAGNHATIATSETYASKQGALKAAGQLAKALGIEVTFEVGGRR